MSLSAIARAITGSRRNGPAFRIVARLERAADDWLVARGSAHFEPGTPADVTLSAVMY